MPISAESDSLFKRGIDSILDFKTYWDNLFWKCIDSSKSKCYLDNNKFKGSTILLNRIIDRFKPIYGAYNYYSNDSIILDSLRIDTLDILLLLKSGTYYPQVIKTTINDQYFIMKIKRILNYYPIKSNSGIDTILLPFIFRNTNRKVIK